MNQPLKSNRIACFLTVLVMSVFMGSNASSGLCQDDPNDPFAPRDSDVQNSTDELFEVSDETELDRSLSDGVRLVMLSVRESNPSTPIELARAIQSMLNIRQYSEAKRYLGLLINSNADEAQLFEMHNVMGPAFLLDLRDQVKLQPEAKQFAAKVFENARRLAYAPARIEELIGLLGDDDQFVRSDAFRKLKKLGAPAAAAMLNACVVENRKDQLPFIQSALKQMGEPALLPMLGAVRVDGTVAQAVSVGALGNIDSPLATDALYRASISSRVPASVRAIAAETIAGKGLNSPEEIQDRIYKRANRYLDGDISLETDANGDVEIWNWNFAEEKLLPTRTSAETAARILAVDLARDVYQLNSSNPKYRQLQLVTVLEATKRVLGPNRFVLADEISPFVENVSVQDLDLALGTALRRELFPAAIGGAELMGQIGDASILMTPDGRPGNLVLAILSGQRHLQFAAAKTIAQLDPKSEFPGCSYVARFMMFLANSFGVSAGLASHPQPEIAQKLASSISQSGLVGVTSNSAQELFDTINSNPDIAIVLVTDTYSQPHYQEIVQQIRDNWLTKRMPVGLVLKSQDRERQAALVLESEPFMLVMPVTTDPRLVFGQIQRLQQFQQPWPVSNTQLDQHAEFAWQWLAKTLAERVTYRFYDLVSYRDQLARLVQIPGSYQAKSQILSNLGTAESQNSLANVAGESGLPLPDRRVLADAFAKSVDQHGNLLTSAEIQQQYDRYNATQSQTEDSQQILGTILDAIESRKSR